MDCALCGSLREDYRLIKETKHSFCVICKSPLKKNHLLIMPKRHVTQNSFSTLSKEEVHDLLLLVEELQNSLNELGDDDVILFKNSGKHSTEAHLHFHMLPSKGALRKLFAIYEGIPERVDISDEECAVMKNNLVKHLEQ